MGGERRERVRGRENKEERGTEGGREGEREREQGGRGRERGDRVSPVLWCGKNVSHTLGDLLVLY